MTSTLPRTRPTSGPRPVSTGRRVASLPMALALVAALLVAGGRAGFIAAGGDGWRVDPRHAGAGLRWTVGQRPLADRDGRLLATTRRGTHGAVRQATVSGSSVLIALADLNLHADVRSASARSLLGTRALPPLRLSVDRTVQDAAAAALGGRIGTVAVLDVATGRVLALASNAPAGTRGVGALPPGSSFKPFVYGAALDAGTLHPDTVFPVEVRHGGIANYGGGACGGSLDRVIAKSCNASVVRVFDDLDLDRLRSVTDAAGFGAGLAGVEPSTLGRIGHDRPWTAIGQGDVRVDPLTAAALAGAVVADGVVHRPVLRSDEVGSAHRVFEASTAATLAIGMRRAVTSGTATALAAIPGDVVAKTGTAQSGLGYDHAWTIAALPGEGDRPPLAVAVALRGRPGLALVGGHSAAPIAATTLSAAIAAFR